MLHLGGVVEFEECQIKAQGSRNDASPAMHSPSPWLSSHFAESSSTTQNLLAMASTLVAMASNLPAQVELKTTLL